VTTSNRLSDAHGVGVALFVDRQLHGLGAVMTADHLTLLVPPHHGRHVRDRHSPALMGHQRGLQDVVEVAELVVGAHQVARFLFVQAATCLVDVLAQQPLVDVLDGNPQQRELALVHLHLDLFLVAAVHLDGGDAFGGLQVLLEHLFGDVAQPVEVLTTGDIETQDRIVGRIEAQQHRLARLAGQSQHVELLAYVEGGEVHVPPPVELHGHLRQPGLGDRGEPLDSGHHADDLLDRPGDERLHLRRRGPFQAGLHRQAGIGEVG
jgi:hypothetical protein